MTFFFNQIFNQIYQTMKKIFFGCLLALSMTLISCDKDDKKSSDSEIMTAEQFSDYVSKVTSDCKEIISGDLTEILASVEGAVKAFSAFSADLPEMTTPNPNMYTSMILRALQGKPVYQLMLGGIMGELPLQGTWDIDLYNRTGEYLPLAVIDSSSVSMDIRLAVNPDTTYRVHYEGLNMVSIPVDSTEWIEFPSDMCFKMTMETTGNKILTIFDIDFNTELDPVNKILNGTLSSLLGGESRQANGGFTVCDTLASVSFSYLKDGKNMFNVDVTMPCKNLVSYMFDESVPTSVSAMSVKFGFAENAIVSTMGNIYFDDELTKNVNTSDLADIFLSIILESSGESWKGISMKELEDAFGMSSQNIIAMFNSLNISISIPEKMGYQNPVAKIQLFDKEGYAVLYYVCADNSKVSVSQVPMFGYDTIYQCIAAVVTKAMMAIMPILGGGIF